MLEIGNFSYKISTENDTKTNSAEEVYEMLYEAPTEVLVLLSIFYGVISFIAIVGNTLVIWVVATTRQMHTVTNMYIANLAFADVIIGMFCIPFQAAVLQKWHLPEFMCAFCPFVQAVSVNVSVFTLTAIAVDRHRAIINPLSARPTRFKSKMIICGIWVVAFAFAIPFAIANRVMQVTERFQEDGIIYNITKPFCDNVNLSDEQLRTYRYHLVFVQYVVPFCVISFVYIQMAVRLWASRTPGNAQDARDITLLRNKKKVIKMLIIVVVVFGLCWLPLQTYNILYVTWSELNNYRFINIIWFCCDWLAMSNSCCNPFIYGIYNEKFKREFNKRFSACFCKFTTNAGHEHNDRTTSVHTRASSVRSTYANSSTRVRNNCQLQPQQQQQQHHQQRAIMSNGKHNNNAVIIKKENCSRSFGDLKYNPINFFVIPKSEHNGKNLLEISDSSPSMSHGNTEELRQQQQQGTSSKDNNDPTKHTDEIGDGLRKHKGRIIDTNRNQIMLNSAKRISTTTKSGGGNHRNSSELTLELSEIASEYPLLSRDKISNEKNDNGFYNL